VPGDSGHGAVLPGCVSSWQLCGGPAFRGRVTSPWLHQVQAAVVDLQERAGPHLDPERVPSSHFHPVQAPAEDPQAGVGPCLVRERVPSSGLHPVPAIVASTPSIANTGPSAYSGSVHEGKRVRASRRSTVVGAQETGALILFIPLHFSGWQPPGPQCECHPDSHDSAFFVL
jgi:hypothetical protein